MEIYKTKSLISNIKEEELKPSHIRFVSFESAIQLMRQAHNLMSLENAPIGYRVTEQGIEVLY